jgi:hypothetical protein
MKGRDQLKRPKHGWRIILMILRNKIGGAVLD